MRSPTAKEYCHEQLGRAFEEALSEFDTRRRIQVLINEFLPDDLVVGKTALDVGCGLGFFSERLMQRGAKVTACDIGPTLVEKTRQRAGCEAVVADALALRDHFGPDRFELIVSSECIEHTPRPADVIREMVSVLRPGGHLALSTPNILWYPVVRAATLLRLRPFDGNENFSTWHGIRRALQSAECPIVQERGLHLFPFQFRLHRLSTWCDEHLQPMRALMINICVLAQKRLRGPT